MHTVPNGLQGSIFIKLMYVLWEILKKIRKYVKILGKKYETSIRHFSVKWEFFRKMGIFLVFTKVRKFYKIDASLHRFLGHYSKPILKSL